MEGKQTELFEEQTTTISEIKFHKTSNIFVNSGIIGLYQYLKKYKKENETDIQFKLEAHQLTVKNDIIFKELEEVYYRMGQDFYDLSSKKQLDKMENAYYDEEKDKFYRFPKMNTYGLASLITNNAQGTTIKKENSNKIKDLDKENPKLATKFRAYFKENNLKLLSKIYLNEPYKKITTINLEEDFWIPGEKRCPITGEGFKKLEGINNISPFLRGFSTFSSHFTASTHKISQKATYLLRFSPVLAMYNYFNGYDSFICTFFNSDTLLHINELYSGDLFYEYDEMKNWKMPFKRNVKLHTFYYSKKDGESYSVDSGEDSYSTEEITFLILYTFYRNKFQDELQAEESSNEDILKLIELENKPLSLVSFKADKFSSTMRPNFYREFTNAKFIIQLIHRLETNREKHISIKEIWRSLVFKTTKSEAIKDYNKKMKSQRQIRIAVFDKLLRGKSLLKDIESLFYKSYLQLTNGDHLGYHRYDVLLEFLKIYQSTLTHKNMDKSLQERAISLGRSIGHSILNYESPKNDTERKANAKQGRKYLIGLHKARTIEQFRDNLIRLQRKYGISIANDIIENLDDSNYVAIKQYAQIGALNILNTVLSNQKNNN